MALSIMDQASASSTPKSKTPYLIGAAVVVAIIALIVLMSRTSRAAGPQASNIRPCVRNCLLPVEVADRGAVRTLVYFFTKEEGGRAILTDIALAPVGTILHGDDITADYRALFERDYARYGAEAREVPLRGLKPDPRSERTSLRPLFIYDKIIP